MRGAFLILAFAAAAVLAGCASQPKPRHHASVARPHAAHPPTTPRQRVIPASPLDRADPAAALGRAGASDAITPDGARQLFGRADVERREGAGAILTWRTQSCALTLVFAADASGDLRLGAADAAARDRHAERPSLEQCVREAAARRASS